MLKIKFSKRFLLQIYLLAVCFRVGRSLKLPTVIHSGSKHIESDSDPDPVCNPVSESVASPFPDKISLLHMELMLTTGCLGLTFFFESHAEAICLRAMPKLHHLDVFFSKKYV